MQETLIPTTAPVKVAPDTYLIPNLAAAEPGTFVPVNSLVILGREPIIVDTGAPVHRERWLEMVYGLVDPEDIRWVFLSHEDGDHTGSLDHVLEAAPQATLVMNMFSTERLALERPVHLERMIWREPGQAFDAGDRRLRLVLPPIFDGPATRGLFDEKTGVLWSVDTFAALTPGAVHRVEELPKDLYEESFMFFNSLISPWHQFLDPVRYNRHVDTVEALKPRAIASAHGPILVGDAIHDAFDRVRTLAGQPIIARPAKKRSIRSSPTSSGNGPRRSEMSMLRSSPS
jgi:flavorubredoxin